MRLVLLIIAVFFAGCGENTRLPFTKTSELVILTRTGLTTYTPGEKSEATGFEYDLAHLFAEELGVKPRFIVAASDADILNRLKNGDAHLAAAWQIPVEHPEIVSSTPYFQSQNVLVTHEASLPLTEIGQLSNKTVHVVAGSRQETALHEIQKDVRGLTVATIQVKNVLDLMEGVEKQRFEAILLNKAEFNIGSNYHPELQDSLKIGPVLPIVWLFAPGVDPGLIEKANAFLKRIQTNGAFDRLKDRYFGHVNRLTQEDKSRLIERIDSVLPKFRPMFQAAQIRTGIDWRILAALAYQESHWDPLATSPTGVRGLMMLTEDTADALKVDNRLDPAQSIRAGADYLNGLRESLPPSVKEPDRLWLALAAYNLGMGHLNAARQIAKTRNANPDSWYEMKKILPLLAQPQYYSRLKSGKGRGGEAVILTENIRVYSDILKRYEPSYRPMETTRGHRSKTRLGH